MHLQLVHFLGESFPFFYHWQPHQQLLNKRKLQQGSICLLTPTNHVVTLDPRLQLLLHSQLFFEHFL